MGIFFYSSTINRSTKDHSYDKFFSSLTINHSTKDHSSGNSAKFLRLVLFQVRDLFKDRHSLILGFNTFLPKGYEIAVPPKM